MYIYTHALFFEQWLIDSTERVFYSVHWEDWNINIKFDLIREKGKWTKFYILNQTLLISHIFHIN
jgi:predicted glycosyltransferase involved in capsule biosynthesis